MDALIHRNRTDPNNRWIIRYIGILLISLLSISSSVYSQNLTKIRAEIDSLNNELIRESLPIMEKAAIHHELAKSLKMIDPDSAISTLNISIDLLREAGDRDRLYYHIHEKLICLNLVRQSEEAFRIFRDNIDDVGTYKPDLLEFYYLIASLCYGGSEKYDTAFLYLHKAHDYCQTIGKGKCSNYLSTIAEFHGRAGDFELAIEMGLKAKEEDEFANNIQKYINLNSLSKALINAKDPLKWLGIMSDINKEKSAMGYDTLSTFHFESSDLDVLSYDEQKQFLEKAIDESKNSNRNYSRLIAHLAHSHYQNNDLELLEKLVSKNFSASDSLLTVYDQNYITNYYVELLEKKGEFKKALSWTQRNILLEDSIEKMNDNKLIYELQEKYESAEKEKEIIQNQSLIQSRTNQRNIFLSLGIGLLLLSFLTYKHFMAKQYLDASKIENLEKEKKLMAMNAMLEGQEAERIRIAKDLHDGLGGMLSTVKARMSNIMNEVRMIESFNVYKKTTHMVDEACEEVRRISHNLLPGSLRLSGLKTAVEQLAQDLSQAHSFEVSIELLGYEDEIEETTEVFIYRIIQEASNNIVKHARADHVLIQLTETEEEYHITIEDDGVGFDLTKEQEGIGLKSIRSRVEFLKGEFDLVSNLGVGSTLTAHIPKQSGERRNKNTDSR